MDTRNRTATATKFIVAGLAFNGLLWFALGGCELPAGVGGDYPQSEKYCIQYSSTGNVDSDNIEILDEAKYRACIRGMLGTVTTLDAGTSD